MTPGPGTVPARRASLSGAGDRKDESEILDEPAALAGE